MVKSALHITFPLCDGSAVRISLLPKIMTTHDFRNIV